MPARSPLVVLLHGIGGSARFLAPWEQRLRAGGFACHVPTLSRLQQWDRLPDVHAYAQALLATLPPARPYWLLGYSAGALVACMAAAQLKARGAAVAGCVLVCPAPPHGAVSALSLAALAQTPAFMHALLRQSGGWIPPARAAIRRLGMNHVETARQEALIDDFVPESARLLLQLGMQRVTIDAATLPARRLVVAACDDRTIPLRSARSTARLLGAELLEVAQAGHFLPQESTGPRTIDSIMDYMGQETGDDY